MGDGKKKEKRMTIGIDARLWNQTGVGRYIRNLSLNLQKIDKKNNYVLFIRSEDREDVKELIRDKNWKLVTADFGWHSISEQIRFPKAINSQNLDIMHFTYQQGVTIFYKRPYVITVHDLIKHHFMTGKASTGPIWLYGFKMLSYKILINLAVKNASKIIAVSKNTKDEIFDHLMVNKKNVEVIYEAADDFKVTQIKSPNLGKYFLFVGNVYPHKNVENLIKAFNLVSGKENVKLVFAGTDDFFYKRLKKQTSSFIKNNLIIIKENVDDLELAGLYENAVALVRPSYMEGFSLPPIEAMSLDCLVLASDIPVHKEIFGGNIFYFNPNDFVDMSEKMNYVLNLDKKTKEEKIKKGRELARSFSWEKTARETLKIYESSAGIRQIK